MSLNSVLENGKDAILNEDILSELGTTRRSVRQQAIKLQKTEEQEQQQPSAPVEDHNSLPSDNQPPTMESNNKEPAESNNKEPAESNNKDPVKESLASKEEETSAPVTPQKRGRGRPASVNPPLLVDQPTAVRKESNENLHRKSIQDRV
ncbi:uncharacterized protein [Amphiura filiformis]|uniref:uncharacterized protein isoform X2 n=1 Tax=Amphiura filiformis TaxID=82378 RepID=UPI003B224441